MQEIGFGLGAAGCARLRRLATALLFAGAAAASPLAAQAAPKGEIVVAAPVLRQHFDPTSMIATTDYLAYDMLFDGLINLGPDGKQPALATGWTVSNDGKQIDFELRKGVKFHNGDPFTAEDVKFSFEMLLKPDNTHSYRKAFQDSIDHVEVVDPAHARFVLKQPWPSFFTSSRYALQGIIPKNYYEKVGPQGFQDKPVGTGPFKLADMKAGEWTKYQANTGYWGHVPNVQFVTHRLVKEAFTGYAMLTKGEADILMDISGPLLKRIESDPKVRIFSSRYSGTSGLYFSKTEFPQSADPRVRMAVAYALNRGEIAKTILGGVCEPATSIFTPATFGYLAGLKNIPYDPAKAKALLAEAGFKPGTEVSFSLHTESFGSLPNAPQVLEAIAGNLEAVGFKIKRVPLESGAWLAMMRGGKQPGIFYGPSSIPDDGGETINGWFTSWAVWSSGNINVPDYDKIFNQQLQTTDPAKREKLLQEFAKLEDERHEGIPLFWCSTPFAVGPKIKDWKPALGSGYQMSLNTVELAK